jgi:hypothetical protein
VGGGRDRDFGLTPRTICPVLDSLRERWLIWARSEPTGTALVYSALTVAAVSISLVLLFFESLTATQRATLLVLALGAWVVLVAAGWARGTLPVKAVVGAIAATLLFSVATPSQQSKDVFSYTMYGRMITEHGDNPYNSYPMHYEGDPMRRHVSAVWQRTPDIYGPAFTVVMAGTAPMIGESVFRARFVYQLIAAAAIVLLLWLLWRRTRNPVVLAFVGLHPLLAVSVVNGGHPDAIIALAFFASFLLVLEKRVAWAVLAMTLAIAINFSMIVAAGALGVWGLWRWSRRDIVRYGAITLGLGALPYLFLHGWMENASEHQELISRQSIWNPIASFLTSIGPLSLSMNSIRTLMPKTSSLFALILVVVVLARWTRLRTPEMAMAGAVAVFLVTSPWVMPWYAFAAFPLLAMRKPTMLTWGMTIYGGLILVGDQFPSVSPYAVGTIGHHLVQTVVPIAACVVCVVAIVRGPADIEADAPVLLPA